MKVLFSLLFIFYSLQGWTQNSSLINYQHTVDSFDPENSIKYFWLNQQNPISVDSSIHRIWSDNGEIWKDTNYTDLYFIKPIRTGKTVIYYSLKNESKNEYNGMVSFTTVVEPEIIPILDHPVNNNTSDIRYSFIYKSTRKTVSNSDYQICAFPPPILVFNKDCVEIGRVDSFTENVEIVAMLANAEFIRFLSYPLRNMKTNLIYFTPETDYKLTK